MLSKYTNIFIFVLFVALIGVRYFFFLPTPSPHFYEVVNKKVILDAKIVSQITMTEYGQNFSVALPDKKWKLLIRTNGNDDFSYGDTVHITGILKNPEPFETDQGTMFDYNTYLKTDNTYFIISNAKVSILEKSKKGIVFYLYRIATSFEESVNELLPPDEAGLANGMLLGDKSGISPELRNNFITTGTIHIVALSGFNVSIVSKYITSFFALLLPFRFALYIGLCAIGLFVVMTGASATAVRAGVMGELSVFALLAGRQYQVFRGLMIAVLVMLLINPLLIHSVSFQLSVIATLGMIFIVPILERKLWWVTKRFLIRDTIATTLSAQIAVVPLILYQMHQFSVVSFFANIIIIPLVPFAMLSVFIAGGLGLFLPKVLVLPFSYIAYILHHIIIKIITLFAQIPFASVVISQVPLWVIVLLYGIIIWWVIKNKNS